MAVRAGPQRMPQPDGWPCRLGSVRSGPPRLRVAREMQSRREMGGSVAGRRGGRTASRRRRRNSARRRSLSRLCAGSAWMIVTLSQLCLRHHLIGPDLNDVLGLPTGRTYAAVTRACARLRRALGTLMVARWGREDCPDLEGMLVGWDGRPTVLMRQRVRRHIGCCDTCRTREERAVPSEALVGLLAAAARPTPPAGLRDDALRLLAEIASAATEGDLIADLVAHRVGSLGSSGFPVSPRRGIWRTGRRLRRLSQRQGTGPQRMARRDIRACRRGFASASDSRRHLPA